MHEPPAVKADEMANEMMDDMTGVEDEMGEEEQAEENSLEDMHEDDTMDDDEMEEWYNRSMLACQFVWRVAGDVLCQVRAKSSGFWVIVEDNSLKQTVLGPSRCDLAV